jgi:hypothetical protein
MGQMVDVKITSAADFSMSGSPTPTLPEGEGLKTITADHFIS